MSTEEQIQTFRQAYGALRAELGKVIVGQEAVVEGTLLALFSGGHVLLEGVPGLGKTLLVRTLGEALDLSFNRIQFTPDLMPADILGTNLVVEAPTGRREFQFQRGPIFAHLILADEINRATPKTQSALLEAMQERQVTVDAAAHPMSEHFMVIATQNPIEYEGTYPLPEAQLDRFLMKILVGYPSREQELEMLGAMSSLGQNAHAAYRLIAKKADAAAIRRLRGLVHEVQVDASVLGYIVEIVRQSRELSSLSLGASPRAAVMMLHAAKALALLRGNSFVRPDEVQAVAFSTLRHRITLTPEAQIEGLTADACIADLLKQVPVAR